MAAGRDDDELPAVGRRYVIGVAMPARGSFALQSSLPDSISTARNLLSVAPMKIRPDAVMSAPPFHVPICA